MILGILLFEDHRLSIATIAVAAILLLGLLSPHQCLAAADLDIILFLAGTFVVAGYLEPVCKVYPVAAKRLSMGGIMAI